MRRIDFKRACAFTLVELLVVILIIGILLALLLPVLWKVHRRGMAVAAKIAYVDDENPNLCVADANGSKRIRLVGFGDGAKYQIVSYSNQPIHWSPDGAKLAVPLQGWQEILVADVGSGKYKTLASPQGRGGFRGWLATDRITTTDTINPKNLTVLDADSGAIVGSVSLPFETDTYSTALARTPPSCRRGSWITMYSKASGGTGLGDGITILKRDFSLGKRIWEEPAGGKNFHMHPRVDPFAEWVAWTTGGSSPPHIALKALEAPSSDPPEIVATDYASIVFCDWTDDAKLLCNVLKVPAPRPGGREVWELVLLDRTGKLVRDLNIACKRPTAAAWRRYEHQ